MRNVLKYMIIVTAVVLLVGGCKCMQAPQPAAKPPPPSPKPVVSESTCGPYVTSNLYQNRDAVKLTKTMPQEVMANKNFDYYIEVANLTDMVLSNVTVTEYLGKGVKFDSASPSAQVDGNKLVWTMDSLGPKAVQKLNVTGIAVESGCIRTCAKVSYDILTCTNSSVISPALKITKEAPADVLLCDAIPLKITVSNSGTGLTRNVVIKDTLPEGLTAEGRRDITITVGNLEPKQSRTFTVTAKAQKTGTYTNKAVAQADGGLTAESAETRTVVRQPVLALTKTAPGDRFVGREVEFEITVTNKGDAPAANTVIKDMVPEGAKFVKASNGGSVLAGKVTWNIGTLAPNASKKVMVTYMPGAIGEVTNRAVAVATCAQEVNASAKIKVSGIPAVLLEVVDIADPIEVGNNETYEIVVTNQGSIADTNIKIKCILEEQMQYVTSSGPTAGTLDGNTVTFQPLASLAPKAAATWRVQVKALKPADVRFKVILNTDQTERNVEETESTHFYQ